MKKSFAAKRIPRRVGSDEDGQTEDLSGIAATSVKRPTTKSKRSSQSHSFAADDDNETSSSGVIAPKRGNLSRIALQRSVGQRSSFLANELPLAQDSEDHAPTYSAADLRALKDSTPSTPRQIDQQAADQTALDVRNKFGSSLAIYEQQQKSAIPSANEIAEKKARRARLALEAKADEYISLDPDDPGWEEDDDGNVIRDMDGRLVLRDKDKYGQQQSRLVRDDEDIMEGFDEFTGDAGPRIVMGGSTLPVDKQARRQDISAQIAYAEGGSDSEASDIDEKTRNAAFEAAQTRHGAYGANTAAKKDPYAEYRARTPPNIAPIPDMASVVRRLRATLLDMEGKKRQKEAEMAQLTKEKFQVRSEETRVQAQLQEVAEKFRQLKMEKGFLSEETTPVVSVIPSEAIVQQSGGGNDEEYDRPRLGLGLGAAQPFTAGNDTL